ISRCDRLINNNSEIVQRRNSRSGVVVCNERTGTPQKNVRKQRRLGASNGRICRPTKSPTASGISSKEETRVHDVQLETTTINSKRYNTMARFQGMSDADKLNDIQILNRALFFENRGVWAYRFAANRLSTSEVGKAVLALAQENRADHEKHQDLLRNAITELGSTPVQMEINYDLSSFIGKGEGNVDSDVNIAKLALALEISAAIGY